MEFVVTKLNYTAYELDRLYNINSGGCCYLAYKIAYWLEKYGIEYYFVIQNDNPIINDIGKHYCLQVLPSKLYLNKSPLYTHIKSIKRTSSQILDYYKKSSWSEKYDALNNVFVDNLIDNIFEFKINKEPLNQTDMSKEEIIKECLSLIDGFDGSDTEYLDLLHELIDECEIRMEGKEMELE